MSTRTIRYDSRTKRYVTRHASGGICCDGEHHCDVCEAAIAAGKSAPLPTVDEILDMYAKPVAALAAAQGHSVPTVEMQYTNGIPDGWKTELMARGVVADAAPDDASVLDAATRRRADIYSVLRQHRSVAPATSKVHLEPPDPYADAGKER